MSTKVAEAPIVAPEAVANLSGPLREIVNQMIAIRDQVQAEELDIYASYKAKKEEREQIDRMLKVSAPKAVKGPEVKPKSTETAKMPIQELVQPRPWPEQAKAVEVTERIIAAIESYEGEPFQIQQLSKTCGHNRKTVERAIGVMNGEGRIRILGRQPVIGRNPESKGGCPALTFKEVKE